MEEQFENFVLKTLENNEEGAKVILQLLQNYGATQLSDLKDMTDQDAEGIGIKPLQWKMLKQNLQAEKTQVNQKENEMNQNLFQKQNQKEESKINLSSNIQSDLLSLNRQQLLETVRVAEQLERYIDMSKYMKKVIDIDSKLTLEEVHLF